LRGAFGAVAVDLDAVDLRGINSLLRVYFPIIHKKRTPWGSCVTVCEVALSNRLKVTYHGML
jgi:hypothetical protein